MPPTGIPRSPVAQGPLVSCTGIATLDTILGVETLPTGDGKWSATWMVETGGGVAANAAVAVTRLGGRARFIGCVGADARGQQVRRGLLADGVLVDSVHEVDGRSTPTSAVMVDNSGARMIVNHLATDFFDLAEPRWATNICNADAVLVDLRWLAGATASLTAAKRAGVPGIVDVDRPVAPEAGVFAQASHLLFSRDALLAMTGQTQPDEALRMAASWTPAWVGVTLGADGVAWLDGQRVCRMDAYRIRAIDSLAAGDTFHGAFALGLAEGRSDVDALHFANAAAALKCLTKGGRSGIPNRAEVHRFASDQQRALDQPTASVIDRSTS